MCQILVPKARVTETNLSYKRKNIILRWVPRCGILMISMCFWAYRVRFLGNFRALCAKAKRSALCFCLRACECMSLDCRLRIPGRVGAAGAQDLDLLW